MMKRSQATFLGVLLAAGLVVAAPADAPVPHRDAILEANSGRKKAEAYRAAFKMLDRAGLPALMKDEDTGIALQAAWEVHTKPIQRAKHIGPRTDDIYDPDELKKFVAFLKARTKAPVPDWWNDAVVDVDLFPGRHHAFGGAGPKMKIHASKAGVYVPEGAELERVGESLAYSVGGRTVTFPAETFASGSFAENITGVVRKPWAFLAGCYSSVLATSFKVAGFKGDGKPAWVAAVWGSGRSGGGSGINPHWVELRADEKSVYVFGTESHGAYLEAFEAATGKCLFRFCSCYWFNHSESWGLK